jgi:hypothetical protein
MIEKDIFPLDRNHVGIRLLVLVTMFGSAIIGLFIIMPTLTNLIGITALPQLCTTVTGALALGVGASWAIENLLLKVWPSGRWLVLDNQHVELRKGKQPISIRWADRVNVMAWYFVINRGRTWVPKGWYCLAIRLSQNDQIMTPYTFVKPEEAQKLKQWPAFEMLVSRKQAPKRGEEHLLKKVTEQGQLRDAEKDRWQDGVEMTAQDFFALLETVDHNVATWPDRKTIAPQSAEME